MRLRSVCWGRSVFLLLLISVGLAHMRVAVAVERIRGQRVFLPVYSEVPYGDRNAALNLAVTVTLRNLDANHVITLKRVDYIGIKGNVVKSFLGDGIVKPMAAEIYVVRESDRTGGASAGFLVEWESSSPVLPPLLEGVMVNGAYNQGMAFVTSARVLAEIP